MIPGRQELWHCPRSRSEVGLATVKGPVAVLFDRIGPYHNARLSSAAAAFDTVAVEFASDTPEYAWDHVRTDHSFERRTVIQSGTSVDISTAAFTRSLTTVLDSIAPRAIAVPGWGYRGALLALQWATRRGTPAVMMSESQREDAPRSAMRERVKARIVALCDAGFVGGERHAAYLRELGMRPDAIFVGYDVVDNQHFAHIADRTRADASAERQRLGLPARFFLASNRFIPKKNLGRMLQAYSNFRAAFGPGAPSLVLLGDGPDRQELERARARLGLAEHVHMPGFLQYDALPAYYGLAEAFVHASTTEQWGLVVNEAMAAGLPVVVSRACGCAPELVQDGENGFSFDPTDVAQLCRAMLDIAQSEALRDRMGQRSRAIVADWAPARFGNQLSRAVDTAIERHRRRSNRTDRVLLRALTLR
jgi:1,2-diacylglycerol 3-alpha-glucosyltransferase